MCTVPCPWSCWHWPVWQSCPCLKSSPHPVRRAHREAGSSPTSCQLRTSTLTYFLSMLKVSAYFIEESLTMESLFTPIISVIMLLIQCMRRCVHLFGHLFFCLLYMYVKWLKCCRKCIELLIHTYYLHRKNSNKNLIVINFKDLLS